jgi:cation transport protein ChaC
MDFRLWCDYIVVPHCIQIRTRKILIWAALVLRFDLLGSLLWRPEQGWEDFENSIAFVRGYKRLFAQNSCDHRGTPSFPGLVVTLVSDEDLERLGSRDKNSDPSETLGVVYRIPNEKSQAILEDLDFREKGGYSRSVVDVTTPEGRSIRALLYAGTVDNPNFNLCNDLNRVAEIIHTAHGPSGPNKEYLFKLADFLREAGNHDDHVMSLDESVRLLESSAK